MAQTYIYAKIVTNIERTKSESKSQQGYDGSTWVDYCYQYRKN